MSEESVVFNLELQISEMTTSQLRQTMLVATRAIELLRRMGLPENIDAGIAKLQRLVMAIRVTHTALIALETALMPGAGIARLALAGLGLAAAGFTSYDAMRGI